MEAEMILRLVVAGVCGAIIGFERRSRQKEAGLRTHFLVAVGSALIMLVSKYGFQDILGQAGMGLDPSRIAAQVVSGVGFLGAGTILVQRQSVRGLTTAAGLWSTSGIGLAIGAGIYWIGFSATVLVFIGLEILDRSLKSVLPTAVRLTLQVQDQPGMMRQIADAFAAHKIEISKFEVHLHEPELDRNRMELTLKTPASTDVPALLAIVETIPGVFHMKIV